MSVRLRQIIKRSEFPFNSFSSELMSVIRLRQLLVKLVFGSLGALGSWSCGAEERQSAVPVVSLPPVSGVSNQRTVSVPALIARLAPDSLGLFATLREVVDSVRGDREYEVRLPQVRLPDAGAAARINAVLLQQLTEVADTVPPVVARRAVRLARPRLRDHSYGNSSGSFNYEVLYNGHGLLSLEIVVHQPGMSIDDAHHLTFDLRTGRLLKPADLIDRPQALARSLSRRRAIRFTEQVQAVAEELPDDPEMRAQLANTMSGLNTVDLSAADFFLTRRGLVFFEDFTQAFPHPYYSLSPEPVYEYSFAELRPWYYGGSPWRASRVIKQK